MIDIIRNVWNVNRLQIAGGPSWVGEDRFDVEAKTSGKASRDELVAMMRAMLAERFSLAQEQLGLKLDAQTAPADVLVIDRVERPTENCPSRVRQTPRRTPRPDTSPA